jgi:hypothetical protein
MKQDHRFDLNEQNHKVAVTPLVSVLIMIIVEDEIERDKQTEIMSFTELRRLHKRRKLKK